MENLYKDKKVLIFGLGLNDGGLGMTEFFVNQGAIVTVTDNKSKEELKSSLDKLSNYKTIQYHLGEIKEEDFLENDIIVQNPAIRPDNKFIVLAKANGKQIEMEMSLFHKLCPCPIIGITGTRGKSTTTALTYEILKEEYGDRVMLGGNIGKSAIRELPKLTKDNIVVLELSSFQLETMGNTKVSPHIALVTNMYEDHLNWHKDMDDYVASKKNIFKNQKADDITIINIDNNITKSFISEIKTHLKTFSLLNNQANYFLRDSTVYENDSILLDIDNFKLKGEHNKYNLLGAIAITRQYNISISSILKVISTYQGLDGRQQIIKDINGVTYVNDTTATSVEAMIALLDGFKKEYSKKLILISGGVDKGLNYSKVKDRLIEHCKALILFEGTASEKLYELLRNEDIKIEKYFNNMSSAVSCASTLATPGDVIVLCPAAASFNLFKNEFDRGEKFNEIVANL